jgi:hypothetical protein
MPKAKSPATRVMFTYKCVGLTKEDAETPYYYGSLPAKPDLGHILVIGRNGNLSDVVATQGEGLVGDGRINSERGDSRDLRFTCLLGVSTVGE